MTANVPAMITGTADSVGTAGSVGPAGNATGTPVDPALLPATVDILRRLVGFDTTSSRSNRDLIDWAADHLDHLGIPSFVQHGDEPGKANLFATIGPQDRPGVMLSGHSDVVPVAGEVWQSDPFTLTERGGKLFGRGSADMKAYIACCLAMARTFQSAGLRTPVHIALSYNEESNMRGMGMLAAHLASAAVKPAVAIIGEPTLMQVVVANKGAAAYRIRVRGKPVHSSFRHLGVSAVEMAAEIIVFINALQKRLSAAERHDGFEFPHTSLHVGKIEGGTAQNITARDCEFLFEIRTLPGVQTETIVAQVRNYCEQTLLPQMKAVSDECGIEFDSLLDSPGMDERGNRNLAQAVMPLCGCLAPRRVSFGTEGGILQAVGVPTVVCGPGDIFVAHQPDEYVELTQLDACNRFLMSLTGKLA
ncbi:MAG TPA: acetylornithine deacetylase, partial [Lautropia sp.]|nr:acetylornithine deacetylase [Lautropia sp.]